MQASNRIPSWAPLVALLIVSILSLGARGFELGNPCQSPCTTASEHTLIFDEAYYVPAAEVIAHIHPPATYGHYAQSPLGSDPNAEHPQGAKLIIAGAIELFGNGPFAWRIGSLIFGSLAILGMYALVRAAGGGPWTAVGAATLMAADNMMIVSGRIAILDIYMLAPLVWGMAAYMARKPWLAALLLAVADCMKETAPYALLVLILLEIGRVLISSRDANRPDSWGWRPALVRLLIVGFGSMGLFIGGLEIMGLIATPYADSQHLLITGGAFDHLWHIISYGTALTTGPSGPQGIASYPWQWLLDLKPITYLRVNPSLPTQQLGATHPVSVFFGMISPPIIALAIPAMLFCVYRVVRRRTRVPSGQAFEDVQLAILGVAWFVGTWGPYELQSAVDERISYLYYMVIVMPGIYLALAYVMSLGWRRGWLWLRGLIGVWGLGVLAAAVVMFPFVALF